MKKTLLFSGFLASGLLAAQLNAADDSKQLFSQTTNDVQALSQQEMKETTGSFSPLFNQVINQINSGVNLNTTYGSQFSTIEEALNYLNSFGASAPAVTARLQSGIFTNDQVIGYAKAISFYSSQGLNTFSDRVSFINGLASGLAVPVSPVNTSNTYPNGYVDNDRNEYSAGYVDNDRNEYSTGYIDNDNDNDRYEYSSGYIDNDNDNDRYEYSSGYRDDD